jgi:DnaJ-class molecular chaperone
MKRVDLYTNCPRCKGQGLIPGEILPEACPACRGRGYIPTEEGRTILGFLKLAERLETEG